MFVVFLRFSGQRGVHEGAPARTDATLEFLLAAGSPAR